MMGNRALQPIAWNGIGLKVPGHWELTRVDHRYLSWENEGHPALEMRWNSIRGKFDLEQTLKKLHRGRWGRASATPVPWDLPENWLKALGRRRVKGFSWHTDRYKAQGVLIFCEICRTATLIQMFQPPSNTPSDDFIRQSILSSFQDHGTDGARRWRIYDIQARLPEYFDLKGFQFQPGKFQLKFHGNGKSLELHRWSPAAVLLAAGDLKTFALDQGLVAGKPGAAQFTVRERSLEWSLECPPKSWLLFRRASTHGQRGRLWYIEKENRILGVILGDRDSIQSSEIDALAGAYGLASS